MPFKMFTQILILTYIFHYLPKSQAHTNFGIDVQFVRGNKLTVYLTQFLSNSMDYETLRLNAAFTSVLQ